MGGSLAFRRATTFEHERYAWKGLYNARPHFGNPVFKKCSLGVGECFAVSGSMLEGHFGDYTVKEKIKEVGTKAIDSKLN